MRTCVYSNGDVLTVPNGVNCPILGFDPNSGEPIDLVDWSDSIDVIEPPLSPIAAMVVAGVLLLVFFGWDR